MGYGRAGWYSYDALDMNRPSSSDIDPSLAHVDVGDILPTHPGGGFEVRIAEPPHALVVFSDTELVRRQAEEAEADAEAANPANIQATGAFLENAQPADFSRFVGVRRAAAPGRHEPADRALPRPVRGG